MSALYRNQYLLNGNFKLVGLSSIQLFRVVDLALHRATFYLRPDLLIIGVSYVWRRAEVSIPIRVLAVPTVFKTVLRAVAINPPNIAEVFVLCAVSYGAFKDRTNKHLSEVCLLKPNLAFSIRSHCVLSLLWRFARFNVPYKGQLAARMGLEPIHRSSRLLVV